MENKTHWRTFHETEFLGAFDLQDRDVTEVTALITSAQSKEVTDQNGQKETILSCTFEGFKKPMMLNATNCKAIEKVAKTPFINDWHGTRVTIYIQKGIKAFGKIVDGLRIKSTAPAIEIDPVKLQADLDELTAATTLDQLKTIYAACNYKNHPKVVALKDLKKKSCK